MSTYKHVLLLYLVPAALYCLYNNLSFTSLSYFNPTTYFMFMQIRLLLTGVIYQVDSMLRKKNNLFSTKVEIGGYGVGGNLCFDVTVTATLKRDSIEGGADEPGIKKASKITHSLFIDFQCFQRHFLYTGYLSKIRG